jgi:hypothetical protein
VGGTQFVVAVAGSIGVLAAVTWLLWSPITALLLRSLWLATAVLTGAVVAVLKRH